MKPVTRVVSFWYLGGEEGDGEESLFSSCENAVNDFEILFMTVCIYSLTSENKLNNMLYWSRCFCSWEYTVFYTLKLIL